MDWYMVHFVVMVLLLTFVVSSPVDWMMVRRCGMNKRQMETDVRRKKEV